MLLGSRKFPKNSRSLFKRESVGTGGRFDPVVRECLAVAERAGAVDLTAAGKLELRGPGAAPLLDRLTAAELPAPGDAVTAHLLTAAGRVYAEMTVARLDELTFFCITGAASERHDLRYSCSPTQPPTLSGYKVNGPYPTRERRRWVLISLSRPRARAGINH